MIDSTALALDAGKYLVDKLLERSDLLMVMSQMADKVALPQGMAKTAEFIRYLRMAMPMDTLTEGVTPSETDFSIERQTITVDQWGLFIKLTDVALLTTKHPVFNEATSLLADSVARVQDFIVTDALMAGTNIQFHDGSVASRAALVAADVFTSAVFNKARATLNDDGAPPREGNVFVAVCGPQVEADIVQESANNSFASFNSYAGKIDKLEKGTVGTWLGFRVVRTNFIPKFNRFGNDTAAVNDGAAFGTGTPTVSVIAGSLGNATFYWKVVRKSIQRGFSEDISIEHTIATGAGSKGVRFALPATAGYVYDVYFGSATGDANLWLHSENNAPSANVDVTTVPASGAHPPSSPSSAASAPEVHPIFCFAKQAVDQVDLSGSSMMGVVTPATASDSDPLVQRRKVGSKFMSKAGIRNSERLLRIELCSNF